MTQQKTITIYTDGACKGNPGPGAWAAVLESDEKRLLIADKDLRATNNQMELTAAVRALQALKHDGWRVQLFTDSQYLQQGITQWLPKWKAQGWKTASKKPVKNRDLWETLDVLAGNHDIEWSWVRGHDGNVGNELADQLANRALSAGAIREYNRK